MAQLDWLDLSKLGFQDQSRLPQAVTTMQLAPLMTPEERKRLEAQIAQNNGGATVFQPPTTPAMDPASLQQLPGVFDMQSPEDRALQADLREKYKQLFPEVESGIDSQKQIIDDVRKMQTGFNFTPLAALADKFSGGGNQLTTAAQSLNQFSPQDKAKLIANLTGQTQDDQKALLSELGARLNARDTLKMAEAQMKNQRMLAGQGFQLDTQFDKNVRSDMKNLFEAAPSMQSAQNLLTPDATGQVKVANLYQALSNVSRQLGEKGVLTDQDIARVQLPTINIYLAKLEGLAGDPNASIPASEIAPLMSAIQIGQQALRDITNERFNKTTDSYIARGGKPQLAESYRKIYAPPQQQQAPAPQAPAGPSIQEILKKRK